MGRRTSFGRAVLLFALGIGAMVAATAPGVPAAPGSTGERPVALNGPERTADSSIPFIPDSGDRAVQGARPEAALPPVGSGVDGALGIPDVALAAYRQAADRLAVDQPTCNIPWNLLAGIGHIESGHARGGQVDANGRTGAPIVGPVLDGTADNAAIADTDGGRLDGDPVWDRAVGPMQFIPESWARWGADGNGDGEIDPSNIVDAALASGRYLCAGGGDLTDDAAARAAVFTYNHSNAYVDDVMAWAQAYATGAEPVLAPPVPVGPAGPPPVNAPPVVVAPLAPPVFTPPVAPVTTPAPRSSGPVPPSVLAAPPRRPAPVPPRTVRPSTTSTTSSPTASAPKPPAPAPTTRPTTSSPTSTTVPPTTTAPTTTPTAAPPTTTTTTTAPPVPTTTPAPTTTTPPIPTCVPAPTTTPPTTTPTTTTDPTATPTSTPPPTTTPTETTPADPTTTTLPPCP